MHPERYPDEQLIAVDLLDVAGRLGEGWTGPSPDQAPYLVKCLPTRP